MESSAKITFNIQKRFIVFKDRILKDVLSHSLIIFFVIIIFLISEQIALKSTTIFILSLSIAHSFYIFCKNYKINLSSIEFIDGHYIVSYSKWFRKTLTEKVDNLDIKFLVVQVDPNKIKRGISYSEISFTGDKNELKFKILLIELKDIILFCSKNKPLNLSINEVWDINEISTYKGFNDLKKITKDR